MAMSAVSIRDFWRRWLLPVATVLVFLLVAWIIHRELAQVRLPVVLAELRAIPAAHIGWAMLLTIASYVLLTLYDALSLRYIGKPLPYARTAFTSFIAYAFGHNLGVASLTGAAVRYRLYASSGLSAADVATVAVFCSLTTAIGLAVIAGVSFLVAPAAAAAALHLATPVVMLLGVALLSAVALYALWSLLRPGAIELGGWSLRAPKPGIALTQILVGAVDLACSAAVLWMLLPADAPVTLPLFVGVYAVGVTAGVISHVPGGLGVFESVIVLALPGVPGATLAGSLLAWRAVYYVLPLAIAALMFGAQELLALRPKLSRAEQRVAVYVTPVVPQVSGALVFLAGFLLLVSGATPAIDSRIALLWRALPLAVLEISHLAGSVIGLALIVIARALFRRVAAAYQLTVWLLIAGIVTSLLKGLEVEQAIVLAVVLAILWLGRRAFYRPAAIMAERFTPVWTASLVIVVAAAVWVGFGALAITWAIPRVTWHVVLYSALSLTLVRMVPVALALLGKGVRGPTMAFIGWFGPRGLASIVFALLVVERGVPQGETLLTTVVVTVALSVVLHGLTSVPLVRSYHRWYESHARAHPAAAESAPATMPRRRRHVTARDLDRLRRSDARG